VTPAPRAETVKAIEGRRAHDSAASVPKPVARAAAPAATGEGGPPPSASSAPREGQGTGDFKDKLLDEIRKQKKFFYGTVVAQAQRIDIEGDKVVFAFGPQHRALRTHLEQNRPWLEETASGLAGRKIAVVSSEGAPSTSGGPLSPGGAAPSAGPASYGGTAGAEKAPAGGDQKEALKQRALSDSGVQTMLDVFAAEIKDVEEM